MDPLIIGMCGLGIIGVAARSYTGVLRKRHESMQDLRASWGNAVLTAAPASKSALYHDLCSADEDTWFVDDRTWSDLYLPEVFRKLNHTCSSVGGQMLYRLLRLPSFSADEIARRDRLIHLLSDNRPLRESLQQALQPLNSDDAALLPNLFLTEIPPRPSTFWVYPLLTFTMVAGAMAAIVIHPLVLGLVALAIVNIIVSKTYRDRVDPYIQPIRVLNTLVSAARKAAAAADNSGSECLVSYTKPISDSRDAMRTLDRTTRWLLFERNNSDDLGMIIVEYINMLLLLDVNSFVFSMEAIRKHRSTIKALFEAVGTVDAMLGIASYRTSLNQWCTPEFETTDRQIEMLNALHPLIPDGVPNSLTINQKGILITGSNMSGKTTFIRTVGINALLAQSIATCIAEQFRAPLVAVETSIGRSDSLSEGKSYYLDEVETIGAFLADSLDSAPCLFIIDEIYRGTNTTERVAASKAVLDALNRVGGPHIVLVSTHDVELPNLLETPWDRYHFREFVRDGDLLFDYQLRPGLSSTRNALRLLASCGYPSAVVKDAEETARKIEDGLHRRQTERTTADLTLAAKQSIV